MQTASAHTCTHTNSPRSLACKQRLGNSRVCVLTRALMRDLAVRTVEDKEEQLRSRRDQQRALGKQIDKIIADAQQAQQDRAVGCGGPGLCQSMGRNIAKLIGLSRRAGAVSTSDIDAVSAEIAHKNKTGVNVPMGGGSNLGLSLLGKPLGKKATAAGKLESATSAMRARVEELDRRVEIGKIASLAAMKSGNKQLAMRELKRAKAVEKQAVGTQSVLDALEAQSDMLEQTALQREVACALGESAKSIKSQKGLLSNAEDAVDAAAEMRDMHEDMNQVMSSLGESISNEEDDDDLMKELQKMMTDDIANPSPTVSSGVEDLEKNNAIYEEAERTRQGLPSAPTSIIGDRKARKFKDITSVALLAPS